MPGPSRISWCRWESISRCSLLWGPQALGYVALSFFFSIGLHPLGARWVQRHYMTGNGGQETFSYYGAAQPARLQRRLPQRAP